MRKRLRHSMMAWVFVWMVSTPVAYGQELIDYIVAVVENDAILYSDIMQAFQMYMLQSQTDPRTMAPEDQKSLQDDLLQRMIDARILIATARRDSLGVPVDQIDNAVRQIMDQLREQYGSDEALEQALAQEGMNTRDWQRLLRQQKEEEIQQRKLEESRFGEVRVSGREVEEFYTTYKDSLPNKPVNVTISHIMVTVRPDEEQENVLRERIEEIQRQIDAGADFSDLAKRYSEDLASAQNGGDLGYFGKGELVTEFEDAAFNLEPGEISPVVRTPYGFHLIKLEQKVGNRARARHILIQVPISDEDHIRTRETLGFLRERVVRGDETFELAAEKYSEDIDSSQDGGSLGEYPLEELQPQYQEVVQKLELGEISEPIQIQDVESTFHLIRLDDRNGGNKLNLDEDWDAIALMAKQKKWQNERRRWLDDLKLEIFIDERGFASGQ